MKILQVNSVYPLWSTGKITDDIHVQLLNAGHTSTVCYGLGKRLTDKAVHKTSTRVLVKINRIWARISGVMYGGNWLSTLWLKRIICKTNPDIVHLQCINGNFVNIYQLIRFLRRNQIPTVLTLHAEFMYTGNCGHSFECERWKIGCGSCPQLQDATRSLFIDSTKYSWKQMYDAFDGFDSKLIVVSVSPWLMQRAKQSPILANKKHFVIYNGLDTSIFHYYPDTTDIRKELGIDKEEKVVIHVTPYFTDSPNNLKGGKYVIELARKMQNTRFVVVGPTSDSISNMPQNIMQLGSITDPVKLAKLYSMADVSLLTSKRETFSMVCAESLCCGTPIVGFKAGAPEQISIAQYSTFVEYGDVNSMQELLLSFLSAHFNADVISQEASSIYSKQRMTKEYITIYNLLTTT
jgi:glycosyltransferase involved in cell wall biosynthesis